MTPEILSRKIFLLSVIFLLGSASSLFAQSDPLTLREAIEKNLLQQPAIRIALENINIQKGIAQSSAAPFDPVVNSEIRAIYSIDLLNIGPNNGIGDIFENNSKIFCGVAHTNLTAREYLEHLDYSQKLRNGTIFTFTMDLDKLKNPLNCPRRLNTGTLAIEINQPLLRDFEQGLERMTELANIQLIDVVRFDTLQAISQQVLNTIFIYWDTVAAKLIFDANLASEKRLEALVEKVKYIIEHKQLAESDLVQPLAQLAAQVVVRLEAEQAYYAALQQLKLAIGEWHETQPCPTGAFEPVETFPFIEIPLDALPKIFCQLFPQVYHQRFDILASATRESVYKTLLLGAKNFELPRLDIIGKASVRGAKSGPKSTSTFSPFEDTPQKDFTIGVVFSMPLCQDQAKGLIRQYQSQWSQAIAQTRLLKQQALAEINESLRNQLALQKEVIAAKQSAEEYDLLLNNETKKLLAGYSNLFYLLSYEGSLTNAMITYIQLQDQFAKNIAQLRFLTGMLLRYSPHPCIQSFIVEDPTLLPLEGFP